MRAVAEIASASPWSRSNRRAKCLSQELRGSCSCNLDAFLAEIQVSGEEGFPGAQLELGNTGTNRPFPPVSGRR